MIPVRYHPKTETAREGELWVCTTLPEIMRIVRIHIDMCRCIRAILVAIEIHSDVRAGVQLVAVNASRTMNVRSI